MWYKVSQNKLDFGESGIYLQFIFIYFMNVVAQYMI